MNDRVVSDRFPFIPLEVHVRGLAIQVEALLDTGFDGAVALPSSLANELGQPTTSTIGILADGSSVRVPIYAGQVRVGATVLSPVEVMVLGDEALVGRGISDRFPIILDHGRQIVVEP